MNIPIDAYAGGGIGTMEEVNALLKALQAPESMGDFAATGAGPLTPQSLEGTMVQLTFTDKLLSLWKDIPKGNASSTVEEFTRKLGLGLNDGGWVSQMENPESRDPKYGRDFAVVKFLRDKWEAGSVASYTKAITSTEVEQKKSAVTRLLRRLNQTLYSGNSDLSATSIDGFQKIIEDNGSADHVIDFRGNYPTQPVFNDSAQLMFESLANPDGAGLYVSPGGLNALSGILDNTASSNTLQRYIQGIVSGDGKMDIGHSMGDIITNYGKIKPKIDLLLGQEYENKTIPKIPNPSDPKQLIEGATSAQAPGTPTIAITTQTTAAGSLFSAGGVRKSGSVYQYRVCAVNRFGRSAACAAAHCVVVEDETPTDTPVLTGGSNTVTITPGSGSFPAEYFEIYSEQVAGSGDFKLLGKIAVNGSTPVPFVDKNEDIPGTARLFLLDFTSQGEDRAFQFKQLAPLHNEPLGKVGPYTHGLVNMYGVPIYYKPKAFIMFKNIPVTKYSPNNLIMV